MLFGISCLGYMFDTIWFGIIVYVGQCVWDNIFGFVCLIFYVWDYIAWSLLSGYMYYVFVFGNMCLGYFVWDHLFGLLCLVYNVWDYVHGLFCLDYFSWVICFGICCLGYVVRDKLFGSAFFLYVVLG